MKRNGWIGLGAAVVIVAGGTALLLRNGKEEIKWRTGKVDKGSVTSRISATGTLNALIQVPVGTQVSGVVTGLFADFNSLVKKGQVIGKIDETPWVTALNDAEAGLQRAQAALVNAQVDYKRNKQLWEQKLISDADLDGKDLALKTAKGNLDSAKAAVARARTNLSYCTLRAPVDGVVVARMVDVGQTVAASFSTPNMFTIAQDLSKMKVQAAIDEADIGQVRVGQQAFFTVDSYPEKQFRGVVSEVQLNPVINQNVVTYNVVMEVTNEPRYAQGGGPRGEGRGPRGDGQAEAGRGGGDHAWRGREGAGAARGPRPEGGPGKAGEGRRGEGRPAPQGQSAEIELNTARYIPKGSAVYKGELALFPGMTANCTIVTNQREQVLRVPAAALRFNPGAFLKDQAPQAPAQGGNRQAQGQGGAARQGQGGGGRQGGAGKGMATRREDRVWVLGPDGKPKPLPVRAGASDGMFTEISGENVTEGMVVLVGVEDLKKQAQQAAAPFGPGGMRH